MEGNKEEAARCRDLGADALRNKQNARAVKFFTKSLQLYPLPGVKSLLEQAERMLREEVPNGGSTSPDTNGNKSNVSKRNSSADFSSVGTSTSGENGRSYTSAQVEIVNTVLKAKEGGRGAHYRVLGLESNCDEAALKKAYRKLALKLHPDKNSAPHAAEAFKAVGLAYATLSDSQKRTIYDRYGEEDPDNRGGSGGRGRGGNVNFHGQEVSPEDIFNMFFGGMSNSAGGFGGPGVRVYSSGFGPGFAFGGMNPNNVRTQRQQQQARDAGMLPQLFQLLPLLLFVLLSFSNMMGDNSTANVGSKYFSLTPVKPFTNPLHTKFTAVKEIPYFVSDQFLRTIHRDRYQLSQVERMVEQSYERYLIDECKSQKAYKRKLEILSFKSALSEQERENLMKRADTFELTRCGELRDLFPTSVYVKNEM